MRALSTSLIFLLFFCAPSLTSQELALTELRSLFASAAKEKSACNDLLQKLEPVQIDEPLLYGYKGATLMLSAEYPLNPFKKLLRFNNGKEILESAITAGSDLVELRFLRLAIQKNSPPFLGYKDNIQEDSLFLENALPEIKDLYLKNQITLQLGEHGNAAD